jgi:hypothetical protein
MRAVSFGLPLPPKTISSSFMVNTFAGRAANVYDVQRERKGFDRCSDVDDGDLFCASGRFV